MVLHEAFSIFFTHSAVKFLLLTMVKFLSPNMADSHGKLKVPLTPKLFFALLQNVSDLGMFKTKIKKIHKILTLLWMFKVAMFSFSTAL